MLINRLDTGTYFENLVAGDVFIADDIVFMKIREIKAALLEESGVPFYANAVCLGDGVLSYFDKSDNVLLRAEAYLTIK